MVLIVNMSMLDKVKHFMEIAGQTQKTEDLSDLALCKFRMDLINEEVRELEDAIYDKNKTEVIDSLADIMYVVLGAAVAFDIDLDKAFDEVHRSNMTKFCKTEAEAKETVDYYNKLKKYDSPTYEKRGDLWVVFNKSTGKVLKSIEWSHPYFY